MLPRVRHDILGINVGTNNARVERIIQVTTGLLVAALRVSGEQRPQNEVIDLGERTEAIPVGVGELEALCPKLRAQIVLWVAVGWWVVEPRHLVG